MAVTYALYPGTVVDAATGAVVLKMGYYDMVRAMGVPPGRCFDGSRDRAWWGRNLLEVAVIVPMHFHRDGGK